MLDDRTLRAQKKSGPWVPIEPDESGAEIVHGSKSEKPAIFAVTRLHFREPRIAANTLAEQSDQTLTRSDNSIPPEGYSECTVFRAADRCRRLAGLRNSLLPPRKRAID
jgi:hypothetical protein